MTVEVRRYRTRDAWLTARRIGSSDVAAILGVGPTDEHEPRRSPWDVWLRLRGEAPPDRDSEAAARGRALEPRILRAYAESTGRAVVPTPPGVVYFRDHWASATPDARDELGTVEAKSDRNPSRWGPPAVIPRWDRHAREHVRPDYALQTYHQMWVLGAEVGHLAVLLPGRDPFRPELRVYRLHRDPELERRLVERLSAWWDRHIVASVPPDLDGSSAASSWLARFEPDLERRRATPDEVALAAWYATARDMAGHWDRVRETVGQRLVLSAGRHRQLDLPAGRVTVVRSAGRSTLDQPALLENHPELAPLLDRYRREGRPSAHVLITQRK